MAISFQFANLDKNPDIWCLFVKKTNGHAKKYSFYAWIGYAHSTQKQQWKTFIIINNDVFETVWSRLLVRKLQMLKIHCVIIVGYNLCFSDFFINFTPEIRHESFHADNLCCITIL